MHRMRMICWFMSITLAAPFAYRGIERLQVRAKPLDLAKALDGKDLFVHEWLPKDPLANGGDGLGPVFNGHSCVECHLQGGVGGSGPVHTNVNVFTIRPRGDRVARGEKPRQGVVHTLAIAPEFQETFSLVSPELPATAREVLNQQQRRALGMAGCEVPSTVNVSQRKTPALFGAGLIDAIPDRLIIANERMQRLKWGESSRETPMPVGRALRTANGRVGKFGWKAETVGLSEFVQAACANELGLSNPGNDQPAPLGKPNYRNVSLDLTKAQCDQMTEFVRSLSCPVERTPQDSEARYTVEKGRTLFTSVGCADCHTPNLGSVKGLYSDLLLHDMGEELEGGGGYGDRPIDNPSFAKDTGPRPPEWRTPPLWGVARSAPYLHDGRASTLDVAIQQHGGQGKASAGRYAKLVATERDLLIAFLKTLDTP